MVCSIQRMLMTILFLNGLLVTFYLGLTILKRNENYDLHPVHASFNVSLQYTLLHGRNLSFDSTDVFRSYYINNNMSDIVDFGNQTRFNVMEIQNIIETPWKNNLSFIQEFRHDLSVYTESLRMLFVTKESTKIGSKLQYVWKTNREATISKAIYNYLPKHSPFSGNFSRCSIVGNSGILKKSECGADIDKSDFIIRCNAPPIHDFEVDAGRKSNLTTVNPSILRNNYNSLRTKTDIKNYLTKMQQYKVGIWFPSFAMNGNLNLCIRAGRAMSTSKNYPVQVLHGHPHHFIGIINFWKRKGVNKIVTTGFYMTNVALQLCNEVHLYGFWPFNVDPNNKDIAYHYFDNIQLGAGTHIHNISSEFKAILKLHKAGALRLHLHC